jgi:GMC oxidoreductase
VRVPTYDAIVVGSGISGGWAAKDLTDCATGENERLMRVDMANDMAVMLSACGVKDVTTFDDEYFPGMGIHEMGTATKPTNSVLNKYNQVWDAPNVFVTDGSCMASTACQNPSLESRSRHAASSHSFSSAFCDALRSSPSLRHDMRPIAAHRAFEGLHVLRDRHRA